MKILSQEKDHALKGKGAMSSLEKQLIYILLFLHSNNARLFTNYPIAIAINGSNDMVINFKINKMTQSGTKPLLSNYGYGGLKVILYGEYVKNEPHVLSS